MKKRLIFSFFLSLLELSPVFFLSSLNAEPAESGKVVKKFESEIEVNLSEKKPASSRFPESIRSTEEPDASGEKTNLGFQEAVQLALRNNVKVNVAGEQAKEARARSFSALSGILPNIGGNVYQNRQTINLAAIGLTSSLFPGLDSTKSGPFDSFDARVKLIQNIFNLESIYQLKSARTAARIAELKETEARQQIIAGTAQSYLSMIQARENIQASEANIRLAKSLLKLAENQNQSGFATGIDIVRARTRIAEEESKIIQAKTTLHQEGLRLKRITGIPLSRTIELTDPLQFRTPKKIPLEEALKKAEAERLEIQIAKEEFRQAKFEEKSAVSRQIPSISGNGDYGASGNRPDDNTIATYTVGVQMNVPIFNGGRTLGEVSAAKSRKRQARLLLEDMNTQIEQDIRLALKNLESSTFLVETTEKTLSLSLEELKIALHRFAAGLSNNIEVVTAQTNVVQNRQRRIEALTQYYLAEINLAVALGEIENFQL